MKKLTLFGTPDSPELYSLRDFLQRSVVEYDWIDLGATKNLPNSLVEEQAKGGVRSAVKFPGGKLVVNPTVAEVAQELGWISKPSYQEYDLSIYGHIHVDLASGDQLVARANICATGVEYEKLNLSNEACFFNKGVYYGAGAGEAIFCRGKNVFVVGGGNSAGQAASYFAGFARRVYLVVRKGNLAATLSDYLVKRVTTIPNIEILYNSTVQELTGDEVLQAIKVANSQDGTATWHDTSKLFICIGGKPNTHWANETNIIRDPNGYLITGNDLVGRAGFPECWPLARPPYHLETSVPGSFAAGDVRLNSVKRVASAVGEGAMAVTLVHKYLAELDKTSS